MHIQKQFIDFLKNSKTGFILIEKDKVVYINQKACDIFECDNGQQSLLRLMSSDIMKRISNGQESRIDNFDINGNAYDVNVIFDDVNIYIFVHGITDYEKSVRSMEYKSRCIMALTQYQKQIVDNIATILMGDIDDPELYKITVKSVYRRISKSNAALSEISRGMFSKCENKGCYNANAIIEQVIDNVVNLFPEVNVKSATGKKNTELYCEATALQTAIYSAISAFLYLDKKTGDFIVECSNYKDQVIIAITCKGACWGEEQRAFVNGERPEKLLVDVHRFGYDMLRVDNLMEWQGGSFNVKNIGNSTQVSLILDNKKSKGDTVTMHSDDCEYLTQEDAEIIFSDIT